MLSRSPLGVMALGVAACLVAVGCGADGGADTWELTTVAEGFDGPTQLAIAADGDWIIAELNGGEREGSGRVIRLDPDDPDQREVIVDGLLTPTGVAVSGDQLWVMERRRLTVGPLDGGEPRRIVADEMPFNGRSQGALTATADGGVVYDTSGSVSAGALAEGSGSLWRASADGEIEQLATGFKHAYATTPAADGGWWVTEIGDGRLDGEVPLDELNLVRPGDDGGYPRCTGDQQPVAEFDATSTQCESTLRPHALLAARSTPTSVAVAPWDSNSLLVALWVDGTVVTVPAALPDGEPHQPEVVVDGLDGPQHLVVDGDAVLVTEHGTGEILRLRRSE